MAVVLPDPNMHEDWRSFANALLAALTDGEDGLNVGAIQHIIANTPVDPSNLPPHPTGWLPIWLNTSDALFYLGNEQYDPPTAPNIVYIDTAKIADAAIETNKIAASAVTGVKIADATIVTAKIADATIVTALIGDAAVVNAKIANLAVNEAKIANLAVTSAKIANLAVGAAHIQAAAIGTAHIQDGSIVNAKIGNVIQSASWNETTKQGWHIDKAGLIRGSGIAIYDTGGNLLFGSGGEVAWSKITGANKPEDNATQSRVFYQATQPTTGVTPNDVWVDISSMPVVARVFRSYQYYGYELALNFAENEYWVADPMDVPAEWVNISNLVTEGSHVGVENGATVGATIGVNLTGQMTAANISTFIAGAAIGTALIGNSVITNALIADAAISTAKIQDASITSAKIISLEAAKVSADSLSAITATVGLLRTATSGARLEIASNQIRVYDSSNVLRVRMGVW